MAVTDPIADGLTIVRNGSAAKKEKVDIKNSRVMRDMLSILKEAGYIKNFKIIEDKRQGMVRVYLRYDRNMAPVITHIRRVSTPGLRVYVGKDNIPRVLNGLGMAILSTPKGIVSDKDARRQRTGGEVLCYIW